MGDKKEYELIDFGNFFAENKCQRSSTRLAKQEDEHPMDDSDKGRLLKGHSCVELNKPVDLMPMLPKNFFAKCESKKWQDRKETLEALLKLISDENVGVGDYSDIVLTLTNVIAEDSNAIVVELAGKCLTGLAQNLQEDFQTYTNQCMPVISVKFEKKKSHARQSLRTAIDAIQEATNLESILEDIQATANKEKQQIRGETATFIGECLSQDTPTDLNKKLLKSFCCSLMKFLNDTEPEKVDSAETLEIEWKDIEEKGRNYFINDLDPLQMNKMEECSEMGIEEGMAKDTKMSEVEEVKKVFKYAKQTPTEINPFSTIDQVDLTPYIQRPTSNIFDIDLDDIDFMFKSKMPKLSVPFEMDADAILNIRDIQADSRTSCSSFSTVELLQSTPKNNTDLNLVMSQLDSQNIEMVVEAFLLIEEVLKENPELLSNHVNRLLLVGSLQYRSALTTYMTEDIIRLYRSVTLTLFTLFNNKAHARKAGRDALAELIPNVVSVMLDTRLNNLHKGLEIVRSINILIIHIIKNANPNHMMTILVKMLHDSVGGMHVQERYTEIVMKCLCKMLKLLDNYHDELNIDHLLLHLHVFLKTYPESFWKTRSTNMPLRIIKTIILHLVQDKEVNARDIQQFLAKSPRKKI